MNSLSSLDLQKNILDELYSLSDNELKRIFPEYEYLDDIVEKCSLKEISDRIEKYTSSITLEGLEKKKTATTVMATGAVKMDAFINEPESQPKRPEIVTLSWLLSHDEGYSDKEYEKLCNTNKPTATVFWYSSQKGKGFLYRQHKGTIHKISIDDRGLSSNVKRQIRCGTIVSFTPYRDNNGHVCAKDLILCGKVGSENTSVSLPDGSVKKARFIRRYGLNNAIPEILRRLNEGSDKIVYTEEWIKNQGYKKEDFEYVFIKTNQGDEYRIYGSSSPITGDGKVENIYAFLQDLDHKVLSFSYDEKLIKDKSERSLCKQEKEEKEDREKLIPWYRMRLIAEIIKLGFCKDKAKDIVIKAGVEKKIKKDMLELSEESLISFAKELTKKYDKRPADDHNLLWFRMVVQSEMMKKGVFVKDCKRMMDSCGFNALMQKKKWPELKDTDPKKVAEEILCKKFFHI